jgi:kinesin family protein 6/9
MLQVFERVAQPVVVSTLDGYNGTVFAYGQTGSGKTFTITGGAERFVDRGVIPRTISSIFKELSSRTGFTYQVRHACTLMACEECRPRRRRNTVKNGQVASC